MKRNIKLTIEYDGTDFLGWQRQASGRTVQQVIEETISGIIQDKVVITGAGRTDTGVHARGQVANFHTESLIACNDLCRALNGVLPDDVVIHRVEEVDESFSSRYSAKSREYQYVISRKPTAIDRKFSWHIGYTLDVPLMKEITVNLLGNHNFQSFCKTGSYVDNFFCDVKTAEWCENDGKLFFSIDANRFLYGMVRSLVGTIVNVGRGFTSKEQFGEIWKSQNRSNAGQSAPPQGLFLNKVIY